MRGFEKLTPARYQEAVVTLSKLTMPALRRQQDLIKQQLAMGYDHCTKRPSKRNELAMFDLYVMEELRMDAIDRKNFNPEGYYGDRITNLRAQYGVPEPENPTCAVELEPA